MKAKELKKVSKEKIGRIFSNGIKLEPHEYETIFSLSNFGFDVEFIKPINTPKSNNPDILMLGTVWEIKSPDNFNKTTIKKRMKKASHQSSHVIFDLRRIKNDGNQAKNFLEDLFKGNRSLKRMIIITENNKALDFIK